MFGGEGGVVKKDTDMDDAKGGEWKAKKDSF